MKTISSGSYFEKLSGYSRMIGDSNWVVSAGTTGFDYSTMTISDELEDQVKKAIENIETYLKEYNSELKDVIICNWVITKREFYEPAASIINDYFSDIRPVMLTLVSDLADERLKFEMQVFAIYKEDNE